MNHSLIDGHVGLVEPVRAVQPPNGRTMSTPPAHSGHANTRYTRETAVAFVIDAVESTGAATRNDFDIDRIVSTAHELAEDWDLNSLQPETFWRIASSCIKP